MKSRAGIISVLLFIYITLAASSVCAAVSPLQRAINSPHLLISAVVSATSGSAQKTFFIIDTGSGNTTIDRSLAQGLVCEKKSSSKKIMVGDSTGKLSPTCRVVLSHLTFSGLEAYGVPALLQNLNFVHVNPGKHQPIGGLLGLDFFTRYHAIIDINHQKIYWQLSNAEKFLNLSTFQSAPLTATSTGYLLVRMQVNQQPPVNFMLDTGSPSSVISKEYAKRNNIAENNHNIDLQMAGSNLHWRASSLPLMDLSVVHLQQPLAGILGMDWLISHKAVIDVVGGRIYFAAS